MQIRFIPLLTILALSPALALAQGRGGAGGARAGAATKRIPPATQPAARGGLDRDRIRQQLQTHATDQQRVRLQDCTQDLDRLRTQSRDILHNAAAANLDLATARQQRDRLQNQFEAAERAHRQLMNSLDPQQHRAIQSQTRTMQQLQSRIRTRLQDMNRELRQANPNHKRLQEQARTLERETQRLQNQYRDVGAELSLQQ